MKFWNKGSSPPPTTIIIKIPEAAAEYLPSPSVARLKILLHMIEVQRPQSTNNSAATGTTTIWNDVPVKTGIETVVDLPKTIAKTINIIPVIVVIIIIERLETLPPMKLPMKRPTNIKNQYVPATKPPIAAAFVNKPAPFAEVSLM